MKARFSLLMFGILFSATTYCQKDYSKWLTSIDIGDTTVQVLRMPLDELSGNMLKQYVFGVQAELDQQRGLYKEAKSIEFGARGQVKVGCIYIQKEDPTFPTQYYLGELKALFDWQDAVLKKRKDEYEARKKAHEDSILLKNLKADYKWINTAFVMVRVSADAKASAIGKIFRLSYVRAYEVEGKDDWMAIDFGDYTGYILRSDLAFKWEEMALGENELEKLKSGRDYHFEPTVAYQAKLDREAAAEKRAIKAMTTIPKRTYIRGPNGGCYYLNANGNKQYVNRSICN